MENELTVIFIGAILILSVLGLSINGIVKKVLDFKRDQNGAHDKQDVRHVSDIAERTQMIEDRVRVLERIATDRGQLLSDEIDALRGSITHEKEKERS